MFQIGHYERVFPGGRGTLLNSFTSDGVSWEIYLEEGRVGPVVSILHQGGGGGFGLRGDTDQPASIVCQGISGSEGVLHVKKPQWWFLVIEVRAALADAYLVAGAARTALPFTTKIGESTFVSHVFRRRPRGRAQVVVTFEGQAESVVLEVPPLRHLR